MIANHALQSEAHVAVPFDTPRCAGLAMTASFDGAALLPEHAGPDVGGSLLKHAEIQVHEFLRCPEQVALGVLRA